jgi:RNA polymerase sigma factor (sigma-70 family)
VVINSVVQILVTNHIDELTRDNQTDGQFLDLFVRQRDQDAFASLVHRHGPMVLGVCRRVLRNPADVDDAFQAAFLVLARKAATIGTRDLLAQWLYGVAYNTARRLQRANSRRVKRERPLAEVSEPSIEGGPDLRAELIAILDEELSRLPEQYRLPIVLCDLEGATRKEAARMLRCPEGTVAGRLARARTLLALRLTSRGVAPTAAILAAILTERHAVAVSHGLVAGVVRAATVSCVANAAAMGFVSRRVASTTEGVLKAMFLKQLKTGAVAALLCGLVIAGMAGLFRASATAEPDPNMPLADAKDDKTDPRKPAAPATPGKKIVTVIALPLTDADKLTESLMKFFSKSITIARVRDEDAILIYATEEETDAVLTVIGINGRPRSSIIPVANIQTLDKKPADPKTFAFNMLNVSWDDVIKWYSKNSGLGAINPVKPEGKFTFTLASDKRFTLGEITDVINEKLASQKLLLLRGTKSFTIVPSDEKIPDTAIPHIELSELSDRGMTELVEVDIPVPERLTVEIQECVPELKKLLSPLGRVVFAKGKRLTLSDTAGSIRRIVDALHPREKPGEGDPRVSTSKAKKIPFRMLNVPWSEVLDWYAKESGLEASYIERPTGTVTFFTPAGKEYTLAEITDLINEALMQQRYLLIRKAHSFTLVPADEKIDPTLAIRTKIDELKDRGNTELVEVILPLPPRKKALDTAKVLNKQLSAFGSISVLENTNTLVVVDVAGHVRRIVQVITEPEDAPLPRKKKETEEKKFSFNMQNAPWSEVLDWYAKETGLVAMDIAKPTGRFTFNSPPNTLLAIGEITDSINEALAQQGFILIRETKSFTVTRSDEKNPEKVVPHIEFSELHKWGKTELVEVDIPVMEEFLPIVELNLSLFHKHLTALGHIKFVKNKGLTVRDTAGNLKRVHDAVKQWEGQMFIKPKF